MPVQQLLGDRFQLAEQVMVGMTVKYGGSLPSGQAWSRLRVAGPVGAEAGAVGVDVGHVGGGDRVAVPWSWRLARDGARGIAAGSGFSVSMPSMPVSAVRWSWSISVNWWWCAGGGCFHWCWVLGRLYGWADQVTGAR
jgi:hypothetical protein